MEHVLTSLDWCIISFWGHTTGHGDHPAASVRTSEHLRLRFADIRELFFLFPLILDGICVNVSGFVYCFFLGTHHRAWWPPRSVCSDLRVSTSVANWAISCGKTWPSQENRIETIHDLYFQNNEGLIFSCYWMSIENKECIFMTCVCRLVYVN